MKEKDDGRVKDGRERRWKSERWKRKGDRERERER